MFENRIASSAGLPINKSTHFLWHTLLPKLALPVCQSTNQQLFSDIHARKSNCQLFWSANQQINTLSLTYTIANTSSAGLPINKTTAFFGHTCSKIELPALLVCQSTNQHKFSDTLLPKLALPVCQSTNKHKFSDTLLPVPAFPVCRSTNQQLFSGIYVRKSNCQLCWPANQQIKIIS